MTRVTWRTPPEQPPAEGASPQAAAAYIEDDLYAEFMWRLSDGHKKAFVLTLCKQKGWDLTEVARCLGEGPLAGTAAAVSPSEGAADESDPVGAGMVASPFHHAGKLLTAGADLVEATLYLESADCHPFDIGRYFRSRGVTTEALHHAVLGVMQRDLPDVLRGMIAERPPVPFPEVLPTFDGWDRQKLEVAEPATHLLARRAWEVVEEKNDPTQMVTFGNDPVQIKANHDGPPRLDPITKNTMVHLHHRLISWGRWKQDQATGAKHWEECEPPSRVVDDMMAEPQTPFPPLVGVRSAPVFGPDGTLAVGPGYDPGSKTFIWTPNLRVPFVPTHPSSSDIAMARHLLEVEVLGGFPFDDEGSRAHTMAAVFHPFVRPMISGPTPIHAFDKPQSGTGATLLADAISFIALGHGPELMTEGKLEDEWRWRMLAALQTGTPIILFDNLKEKLDSGTVSAIVTRPDTYSGRMVGSGKSVTVPVRALWLLTANNMKFSRDNARRSVLIRLDANLEHPEVGRTYLHDPLLPWIAENRGHLVWAALVLIQAWIDAGQPKGTVTKGSYESWAAVVGGIMDVVGIPGFLTNEDKLNDYADDDDPRWVALVGAWLDGFGTSEVKSSALLSLAQEHLDLSAEPGKPQSTQWGLALKAKRDAVFVGHKIRFCKATQGAAVWRLEPVNRR